MIKESVKKKGNYSLEIKFKYRPEPKSHLLSVKKYHLDMYFFLPISLGVNRKNFTKMDFYRELNSYLKIDPPKVLLADFILQKDEISRRLIAAFENYNPEIEGADEEIDSLLKIYVNIFKKAVKRELRSIRRAGNEDEKVRLAKRLISNFKIGLNKFRSLEEHLLTKGYDDTPVNRSFQLLNEYMSSLFSKYSYHIWQVFEKMESPEALKIQQLAEDAIFMERKYKEEKGMPLAEPKDHSKENEHFLFRWEMLKTFVNRKLILTTRFDRDNKWLMQFYYSLAAGIAMIFATGIAFYYNQKFGNFTMRFFVVLVVSYMFKDRIKDWIKDLINYLLKKETYDQTINIYDENSNIIGTIAQGFDFAPFRNLPKEILEARSRTHQTDIEEDFAERVMHYKTRIKLNPNKLYKVLKDIPIRGINDVTYFNTSPLLMRMEDPQTDILLVDNDKNFKKYKSEKVYHINMVLVSKYEGSSKIKRYRIVLNRNGIKRVKRIVI